MLLSVRMSILRSFLAAGVIASCLGAAMIGAASTAPGAGKPEDAAQRETVASNYGHLPLRFEVNQGQADHEVKFVSRGRDNAIFLTNRDAVLARYKKVSNTSAQTAVVRMELTGGSFHSGPVGYEPLPGISNYLLGNDTKDWKTGIPSYARVRYADIYPGIDLVYYGNQRQLEYDFVVAPHADAHRIRMSFKGSKALRIDDQGNLVIETGICDIAFNRPVVYQDAEAGGTSKGKRQEIAGKFVILPDQTVEFAVGRYDRSRSLIIDPTLVYSTYLGGTDQDAMNAIAIDSTGAAYLTGQTESTNYPITPGVFRTTYSSAFVTKLNSSGTALVYSSFLGGSGGPSGGDIGLSIAVDSSGDAYIAGSTYSTNFPATSGAYQTTNKAAANDGTNGFIAKVNPAGTSLLYATYLGGSLSDAATSIKVDSAGDAYVAGYAYSANFPTTTGAFQTTNKSAPDYGWNQFVTKLNPTGSALLYSTYIGGSGDYSSAGNTQLAIDSSGDAYLAGIALSTDFPTTSGAFQKTNNGNGRSNITLTKFNPTATALIYCTYFGGSGSGYGDDSPNGLAVDSAGNAYFSGTTHETNLPVTSAAYQKSSASTAVGLPAAFVTKMNPAGSALVYSTYLGGSGGDIGMALAVDSSGDAYVSGSARSTDFPVTSNAYQSTNVASFYNGAVVFLTEFNPAGDSLLYSTYFGGGDSFSDTGTGIALGSSGAVYLTGYTGAADFPTTSGAYNTTFNSNNFETGFVAEFNFGSAPTTIATTTTLTSNANPAITGSNVTFSAAVVPNTGTGIPTGDVIFNIDQANVATVALTSKGWATYTTTTPLALGAHAVLATYQGSTTYSTSGGNITQTMTPLSPVFTPPSGTYPAAQVVTITDASPGAVIYYTTDGTVPTSSSTKYTGPITVNVPTALQAIGILSGTSSAVVSASYTLLSAPAALAVSATGVSTPNATLNGLVNTFGMSGSYYFQYGTSSTALTTSTAKTALPASALGSRLAVGPVAVKAAVAGLVTKTTYYYQVVVTTPAGSSSGAVLSFTTN